MELRHLIYFIAVAEELHFGRAAKRLHVSQPPLSKQIQDLERELGTLLFERSTQRVTLTPAGKAVLVHARRLVDLANDAKRVTNLAGSGHVGTINVGMVASSLYSVLPSVLAGFHDQFPDVRVTLQRTTKTAMRDAVRERRIDVGFVREPIDHEGIVTEGRFTEDLIVAMPNEHHLAQLAEVPLESLRNERIVPAALQLRDSVYFEISQACLDLGVRLQFTPEFAQDVPDLQVGLALVAAGLGIAVVPQSCEGIALTGVKFRPIVPPAPILDLLLVRGSGPTSPVLRSFLHIAKMYLPGVARQRRARAEDIAK